VTLHSAAATGDLFQAGAVQDQLTKGQRQMVMLAEHYDFVIGGDPDPTFISFRDRGVKGAFG
jgi:hypothetical protein